MASTDGLSSGSGARWTLGLGALLLASLAAPACSDTGGPPPVLPPVDAGDVPAVDTAEPEDTGVDVVDVQDVSDVTRCDGGMCGTTCVDLMTDPRNCGTCGTVCMVAFPNTVATCAGGRCNPTLTCATGFADCDGVMTNGCEVNVGTSSDHCGRCRNVCPAPINASPACVEGVCGAACAMGFGNCDGNAANGCEVDVRRSAANCGVCGRACTLGMETAHATPSCADGACGLTCDAGWGNCDGVAANGCETNLNTELRHCGGCGMVCDAPNSMAACAAGRCTLTCLTGFDNCDGNAANGCEANINTSTAHCGRCANACPAPAGSAATCTSGACGYTCSSGFGDCNGIRADGCETNLATSSEHCGRCMNVCPGYPNSAPSCVGGACYPACSTGFGNCDGSAANGCEVDVRRSATNCGSCGRVCTLGPEAAHATPACADGACGLACDAGWGNCDGVAANGCETNLNTELRHCGGCGLACEAPGSVGSCSAGRCTLTCVSGFDNCDGVASNGCETSLTSSITHCGRCANTCPAPTSASPTCASGACGFTCAPGFGDCNGIRADGCETNLATSSEHCGRCMNVCPGYANGSPACAGGACYPTCNTGFGDCDREPSNGCETDVRAAPRHCGVCGRVCPTPSNADAVCTASVCGLRCFGGFGDCDGNASNGCEVDLGTTLTSCGGCGRVCAPANASGACVSGACQIRECNAGYADCDGNAANGCETPGGCPT